MNEEIRMSTEYFLVFQSSEKRSARSERRITSQHPLFASRCRASWIPPRSLFHIRGSEREAIVEDTPVAAGHEERVWRWPTLFELIGKGGSTGRRISDLTRKGRGFWKKKEQNGTSMVQREDLQGPRLQIPVGSGFLKMRASGMYDGNASFSCSSMCLPAIDRVVYCSQRASDLLRVS